MAKTMTSAAERDTLAKLRAHVADVETRLKKADAANKRSVTALKKAFSALGEQADGDNGDLDTKVNQLSDHLNGLLETTRRDIHTELEAALANPQMDHVTAAVTQANARLTQAEIRQAEAIQKVNQHIARLASALNARLQTETREREAMEARISSRVDAVANSQIERIADLETQTAIAVAGIGDRVVTLGDELAKRSEAVDKRAQERIYEMALDHQHELESHKSAMDRRIEGLEDETRTHIMPVQRHIATLSARIDALESGMATAIATAPVEALPPFPEAPISQATPQDAFSPEPPAVLDTAVAPPPATSQPIAEPGELVEFNPSAYPDMDFGMPASTSITQAAPAPAYPTNVPNPYAQTQAQAQNPAQPPAQAMHLAPTSDTPPPPMPIQQYGTVPEADYGYGNDTLTQLSPIGEVHELTPMNTNPYAENPYAQPDTALPANEYQPEPELMGNARPGAPIKNKRKAMSPRTLRTAASAAALVAVVTAGAFMVKGRMAGTPAAPTQTAQPATTQTEPKTALAQPQIDLTITEPTGKMSTPDGVSINPSRPEIAQFTTLEAAVAAGNPIAELQMGLTLLQQEKLEDAAAYIRKSANKGQPAAQYYLGNMYENGQGVPADQTQARKLTEMAASQGHRIAMYDLALYYIEGKGGVGVNMETAAQWFRKAADFGMTDAQYNLAVLHERGTGVAVDPAESYVWYTIAGANGDQDAAQRAMQLKSSLPGDALGRAEAKIAGFTPSEINQEVNGIFTDLAWNKKRPKANPEVAQVQQLLTDLGFNAGVADGAMGPKTREAIKSFERQNGLPETGQVNGDLITRLSAATGA